MFCCFVAYAAHEQHGLCFYTSKGIIFYRAELYPENTTDPASEPLCQYLQQIDF